MSGLVDVRPELLARAVPLEPAVFLMGGSLALLAPEVRARAESRRTPLASLLAPVPPHWVRLHGFSIAPALVTNGEYRAFLRATAGGLYDAPDLWRYSWSGLGAGLERQTTWLVRSSGPAVAMVEHHRKHESFVEGWLESLRLEAQRLLAGPDAPLEPAASVARPGRIVVRVAGDEGESLASFPSDTTVDHVFEAVAARLSASSENRGDGGTRRMSRRLVDPAALDSVIARLEAVARASASSPLAPRGVDPESLVFLSRVRAALDRGRDVVPLHEVLFPRTWSSAAGEPDSPFANGLGAAGPGVPWAERPVHGVSLYESLAFCLWLSEKARPGDVVTLPNEAEWERAAGWPDAPADAGEPLDAAKKDLFPWGGARDFHDFFGGGARELSRYAASRSEWARVVEATSRRTSRGKRIDQLLGFGWQWTGERFDDDERGYGRFADQTCPFAFERPVSRRGASETTRVFDYVPNRIARHGHFVLRGAPDLIGGQGVTPRRFAANPLRGYPNVGFRWVVRRA